MTDPVRLAVVGAGAQGHAHLQAARQVEGYEIVAVCDVSAELAQRAGAEYGLTMFTDPGELFDAGIADAVAVAVPPWRNVEVARAALESGHHVYCEKPIAPTFAQGRAIDDLARARGLRVQVGFQHRFSAAHVAAHRIATSGELGPLFRSDLFATSWFRARRYFEAAPWRGRWAQAGGGVLMIQAIHDVDAYLWFAGMPSRVTALARRVLHRVEVEDDVHAILEFPSGAAGVLQASTAGPVGGRGTWLHGDRGSLRLDESGLRKATFGAGIREFCDTCPDVYPSFPFEWEEMAIQGPRTMGEMIVACHRDFVEAIRNGREARNNAAEATMSIELANAIYLSTVTGETVPLPLDPGVYSDTYRALCSGDVELPSAWSSDRAV